MAIKAGTKVGPNPTRRIRGADSTTDAWKRRAACDVNKGLVADPEVFFGLTEADLAACRKVCRRCPVHQECLEDALRLGDDWSVRASTTPMQRRKIRESHAEEAKRCRTRGIA